MVRIAVSAEFKKIIDNRKNEGNFKRAIEKILPKIQENPLHPAHSKQLKYHNGNNKLYRWSDKGKNAIRVLYQIIFSDNQKEIQELYFIFIGTRAEMSHWYACLKDNTFRKRILK